MSKEQFKIYESIEYNNTANTKKREKTQNLFCYPPSYEKLSGDLTDLYSRRINRQHRYTPLEPRVDEDNNTIFRK